MLSSTLVSVLGPHWNSRPRRYKRGGEPEQETQGNVQEVVDRESAMSRYVTTAAAFQTQNPLAGERGLRGVLQAQDRAPSLGTRRGTLGWLPERTPTSKTLDTTAPPSSHSLGLHDNSKAGCHGEQLAPTGSKPTTSSLLLSLRGQNSNNSPAHSGPSLTNDSPFEPRTPNLFTKSTNGSEPKSSKSLLFLSPTPYKAAHTSRPYLSQSSSNPKEDTSNARLLTGQKENPSRASWTYSIPSYPSKQTCLSSDVNRLSITHDRDKTTTPSDQPPQYGRFAGLKSPLLSRASTLKSTSWWKRVNQEDGSPLGLSNTTNSNANINANVNNNTHPGGLDNDDSAFRSAYDNRRLSPNGKDDNNPVSRSAHPWNLNSVRVSASPLRRSDAQDIPELDSVARRTRESFNLNDLNSHRAHSLPGELFHSQISSAVGTATLSSPEDFVGSPVSVRGREGYRFHFPLSRSSSVASVAVDPCSPESGNCPPVSSHGFRPTFRTRIINPDQQTETKSCTSMIAPQKPAGSYFMSATYPYSLPTSSAFVTASSPLTPPTTPKLGASPRTTLAPSSETSSPLVPSSPTVSILKVKSYSTASDPASSPLTPPFTPTRTPPARVPPPPAEGRTFPGALDASPTKQEGRQRVTWQDSVEVQRSETTSREASQLGPQTPGSPASPSWPRRSVGAPSTFSSLRSGSPTRGLSPLSPLGSRVSSLQVWRDKDSQRCWSSADSADPAARRGERAARGALGRPSRFTFDDGWNRKESEGEHTALSLSSAAHSLPPDFGSGFKLRYSSPPYSALKSSRSPPGRPGDARPASPLSSPSTLTRASSLASLHSRLSPSPLTPANPLSFPIYSRTALPERSKVVTMAIERAQNNSSKQSSQPGRGVQTSLPGAPAHARPLPLQVDTTASSPLECVGVVETLVYRVSKAAASAALDGRAAPAAGSSVTQVAVETKYNIINRQSGLSRDLSVATQRVEVIGRSGCQSYKSAKGIKSVGKQGPPTGYAGTESKGSGMKESGLKGMAVCLPERKASDTAPRRSVGLKRGLCALKGRKENTTDTPGGLTENPGPPQAGMEKGLRGTNKIELVLIKLRKTFSGRRSDDESLSSWRRKRRSQAPSASGSIDSIVRSNERMEGERRKEDGAGEREGDDGKGKERWEENRYVLKSSSSVKGGTDRFSDSSIRSGSDVPRDNNPVKSLSSDEPVTETRSPTAEGSPTQPSSWEAYKDNRADLKARNRPLSRASSPHRLQPWSTAGPLPSPERTPSGGLRSPLSPFSSLSPFEGSDNDSVFYSPELLPSAAPRDGRLASYSSCADLKYGLGAGRSCSVSSVHSSRPSGPGRISTGPRVASGDGLDDPAATWGEGGAWGDFQGRGEGAAAARQYHTLPGRRRKATRGREGLNQWSFVADRTGRRGCRDEAEQSTDRDDGLSTAPDDPSRFRSRSLPRSLIRPLSAWSSAVTDLPTTTTPTSGRLRSPVRLDASHFQWDAEVLLTPPASPGTKRMAMPPSSSSSPASPISPTTPDSLTSRARLPSRGYVSSLEAFHESGSDADTTTDDEYYLEGDGEDKETEL